MNPNFLLTGIRGYINWIFNKCISNRGTKIIYFFQHRKLSIRSHILNLCYHTLTIFLRLYLVHMIAFNNLTVLKCVQ